MSSIRKYTATEGSSSRCPHYAIDGAKTMLVEAFIGLYGSEAPAGKILSHYDSDDKKSTVRIFQNANNHCEHTTVVFQLF